MVWIQYNLSNGSQSAAMLNRVSDDDLAALGKAQIEYDGDPLGMMVDITQNPPVVIPAPVPVDSFEGTIDDQLLS